MEQDAREQGAGAESPETMEPTTARAAGTAVATAGATAAPGGDMAGATRSPHVVFTLPQDWGTIPHFLLPALERLDRDAAETQLLVVTADAETALAVADAALALRGADRPLVLPVTRPERALRQLRGGPAPAIAGTASALGALVRASALKLSGVRTLIVAWADELLASTAEAAELEAVLAELPKEREISRVLVAAEATEAVEALVERAFRRPRRVAPLARAEVRAVPMRYVPTAPSARADTLRRVLDELDPASAIVVVGSDASEREARRALRALGYPLADAPAADPLDAVDSPEAAAQRALAGGEGELAGAAARPATPAVIVVRGDAVRGDATGAPLPPRPALVALWELPSAREAFDRVMATQPGQTVALVQPRQLAALRALAGGPVSVLPLAEVTRRARERDAVLRAELRAELERGLPPREVLALEPLLEHFDPTEIAAAALRLVERERARRAAASAAVAAAASAAPAAPAGNGMTRLFLTVGTRDGVRPGDLVGAIAGEAGITGDQLGKIDLRESFALVEVVSAEAERVLRKIDGIAIRGRRVNARLEREGSGDRRGGDRPGGGARGGFGGPKREGGARPFGGDRAPRGDRPDRPERRGPGGPGGAARGAGGAGGPGGGRSFDARSDGPRGFGAPDDRDVREKAEQRTEWAERAERLRRARRPMPGTDDADEGGDIRGPMDAPAEG